MYNTIETLYKRGYNKSEIARMTGHDWKTISKAIKAIKAGKFPKRQTPACKLDIHKEQILEWLESNLSGIRIHELLKQQGVISSYSTVKNYIKSLKGKETVCIRFQTLPGEEAQVDFGYVGRLPDEQGKLRKAWVFNMRLSYSRLDYYEVVYNQNVETFINCHIKAFDYFNGVPKVVKIDNLKAAILEANIYQPVYQATYKQFANYYGFEILPCRVRQPQEKGKVESGIKYVKNNFFAGRHFATKPILEQQLKQWLDQTCNVRLHGTTRQIPQQLFETKEKEALKALPAEPYRQPKVSQRSIYRDCHAYVEYNYYSVPYQYVGKTVDIEIDEKLIRLFYAGQLVALHQRLTGRGQFSTQEAHYPSHKLVFSTEHQKQYEEKMQIIGEYAQQLFCLLLKEQPNHWLQTVKGILSLRKRFDDEIINLSCQRAICYGAIQYRQLKSICESGCYRLPIDKEERVH